MLVSYFNKETGEVVEVEKNESTMDGTMVDKEEKNESSNKQFFVVEKLTKYKATVLVKLFPRLVHKDKNDM
jgi:hypothetical protein